MGQKGSFWPISGDTSQIPKLPNNEVSGIGTSKFEFSTIKNHYKDIHNGISDKDQEKALKKGTSIPKSPWGTQTRVLPG